LAWSTSERLARYMRPGTLLMLAALPPLSLYVHLPWCLQKCPYCDFNSHECAMAAPPEARYLDALRADLEAALPLVWGRRVSVFIGGGTPSLFSPDAIDRCSATSARLPLEPGCEITLEANPGTFERDRFRAFREAGVTRLSIGVQSFDDAHLPSAACTTARRRAPRSRRRAHFDTFNLDLMYALPGQTLAELGATSTGAGLRAAAPVALPPDDRAQHAVRQAAAGRPPDDDLASDMLDRITERTARAGWSATRSRPREAGHRCAQPQLLAVRRLPGHRRRRARQAQLPAPRAPGALASPRLHGQALAGTASQRRGGGAPALPFEFMLNALRLREGFEPASSSAPAAAVGDRRAAGRGADAWADRAGERMAWPTPRGFDFLSDLQSCSWPTDPGRPIRRGSSTRRPAAQPLHQLPAICVSGSTSRRAVGDGLARHAEHHAAGLVLGEVVAPASRIPHRLGAIGAHAGQHDAQRIGPATRAADLNSTSTEGLWRLTGSPSCTRAM
jgi:oxygen-independent coproporphyrinogen-3 oxidase